MKKKEKKMHQTKQHQQLKNQQTLHPMLQRLLHLMEPML